MIQKAQNKKVIVSESIFLTSLLQKGLGLMFRITPIKDKGYIFVMKKESSVPITMLNVFFSLDIIWLNKNKEIVALCDNAKPFQLNISPKVKAQYVVELPAGTIKKHSLEFFDTLLF